jgi:hypothetical protein
VSSQTSLIAIDKTKSRPDGQGVSSVDMPVNLPDGWVYDKVFGPPASHGQKAMAPSYNRSLTMDPAAPVPMAMPSGALYGFDGGAATTAEQAASADAVAPTEAAPPVDPSQLPTVAPADPEAGQVDQNYPVLPLTVVPKPEANPLAALKAPHDQNQRIAILALVLALLSAVTFILWRYHRRDYASPRRIGRRI